jgi:glyoxylase-like metal-dependent hydrolase (beta-lactamase superfamily II)
MSPYRSRAQAAYFHMHPDKVGGAAEVAKWDAESKGKMGGKPQHVAKKPAKKRRK